jgi:uncharacterized protein
MTSGCTGQSTPPLRPEVDSTDVTDRADEPIQTPQPQYSRDVDTVGLRIWIDIENPPQVQYLLPIIRRLQERQADVLVTARDYGIALELLRRSNINFRPVGSHFGASKSAKVLRNLRRTLSLRRLLREGRAPHALISVSRSASLTARSLRIPSFVISDYEFVNLAAFRAAGSYILHPNVIPDSAYSARGIRSDRLIPFYGIKEHLTFADVDVNGIPAASISGVDTPAEIPRVLVRPPAEESHYHRAASSVLANQLLVGLARRDDCVVIFSPRYPYQAQRFLQHNWKRQPTVLEEPVSFVSLYKAVDAVISGGGTMTREAAYLGIPAVSIFRGDIGAVDQHLEAIGRLTLLRDVSELDLVDFRALRRSEPLQSSFHACDQIIDAMTTIVRGAGRRPSIRP